MPQLRITEIKTTKKGRYALFCDDGFLFSVDEETLLKHHVAEGSFFSGEELMLLREASDYQRAKNKALELLGIRDHTRAELEQKLRRNFDEHTAAMAVQKVAELGLIDDESCAMRYAAELIEHRGMSVRAAAQKLHEHGVDRELAQNVLEPYSDSEGDRIETLINAKYRSKLSTPQGRRSVMAALARRGFSSSAIRETIKNCCGNMDDSDDLSGYDNDDC